MKSGSTIVLCFFSIFSSAQNVGIGTLAPNAYGHGGTNKLVEVHNSNSTSNAQAHVLLTTAATVAGSIGTITWASPQLSTPEKRLALVAASYESGTTAANAAANLTFYTRTANLLAERMRIASDGHVGIGQLPTGTLDDGILDVGGRLRLFPHATTSAGVWLLNANGNFHQAFVGMHNDNYVGFKGPNGGGGSLLMNVNTGQLAINGNAGSEGQVLQSNGANAPTWVSPTNATYNNTNIVFANADHLFAKNGAQESIPGLSQTFTVSTNAKVIISGAVRIYAPTCALCGDSWFHVYMWLDGGTQIKEVYETELGNGRIATCSPTYMFEVGPGTHSVELRGYSWYEATYSNSTGSPSYFIVQVIPQ